MLRREVKTWRQWGSSWETTGWWRLLHYPCKRNLTGPPLRHQYAHIHSMGYNQEEEIHAQWRAVTSLRLWRHGGIAYLTGVLQWMDTGLSPVYYRSITFEKSGGLEKFPVARKRQTSHPSSRKARRGIWGTTGHQASQQAWENYGTNLPQSNFPSTWRSGKWLGTAIIDLTCVNHTWLMQLASMRRWLALWIRESTGCCLPLF